VCSFVRGGADGGAVWGGWILALRGVAFLSFTPWPPSCIIGSPVGDRGSQGGSKGFVNNGVGGELLALFIGIIVIRQSASIVKTLAIDWIGQ
jgi:hypothetical protein